MLKSAFTDEKIVQRLWPRWMKKRAASDYSSIGVKRLVELAVSGVIRGTQDPDSGRGDWIFDCYLIDEYRESQMAVSLDLIKKAKRLRESL